MDLTFKHGWLAMAYNAYEAADTVYTTAADQPNPRFSKIKEGLAFSTTFVPTYHLVILGVLSVFTLVHWTHKLRRRWVRGTQAEGRWSGKNSHSARADQPFHKDDSVIREDERSGSSSSSSTLSADNMPLLKSGRGAHTGGSFISRIRSIFIYQPRPIPIINKVLPDNGTTVLALGLVALNIFYTLYGCPLEKMVIFVLAGRSGYLFVVNLPLLYFLAAKNQPIKFLTGYSYESLNLLHRRLGEVLCALALLHAITMTTVWYTILRPVGWSFGHFLSQKIIYVGLIAFIAYELLYLTSLGSFRQRWYELFLVSHVALQAGALVLLYLHHSRSRVYVGLALAIFLVDRVVFRIFAKSCQVSAMLTVAEDGKTALISAEWTKQSSFFTGINIKQGWNAMEHVFISVPALSRKHFTQAHPFTIASAAPAPSDSQANLGLIVRAQDGFTKDLLAYAKQHNTVKVRLDGPYGSQTAMDLLMDSQSAVVVAGGSGIAVAYPLVKALLSRSFAPVDDDNLEGRKALGPARKMCLIWVTQEASHRSWLGPEKLEDLRKQGVDLVLPPPTCEAGRPDVALEVRSWIDQYTDSAGGAGKIGVVCSGPDGMNRAVRNTCAGLAARGVNVDVEVEKFGW